jgi:SAM-dependent methyltransferase
MNMTSDDVKATVRRHYGAIAREETRGCCSSDCCTRPAAEAVDLGYSDEDRQSLPSGVDLGLGCGNPLALASLQLGERVLDLGSGPGFDALLAASAVGASGSVIGVDMTPAMIERARSNARRAAAMNVEFRLGEIEHLPVADASVDVVLSNCVINLSPDKGVVCHEAFRVLRPGGRLVVADILASGPLPEAIANDAAAYSACLAGAVEAADMASMLRAAGFVDISIGLSPTDDAASPVSPGSIRARKPS